VLRSASNRKKIFVYVLSFLIPFCFLLLLAIALRLAPFGDNNLLFSDMGAEYMPFFTYFRDLASGGANPLYSFAFGMGDNILSLAATYMLSPFNALFVVFGGVSIDVLVPLVIGLKISAISASMQFYLARTHKKIEAMQLAFSFAYAVCAFVGVYFFNLMWLDAMIFLPLVILSLQRLIESGKGFLFSLALFGTIVTNFYMGYMICLFVIFYYFYWSMRHTEFPSIGAYFRLTKGQLARFAGYAVSGVLMASFILVPVIYELLHTAKVDSLASTFLPTPMFGPDIFMQLGLDNTDFYSRLFHLPSFYTGSLTVFLCALYFQLPFGKKEKRLALGLILVVFASFLIQTFNTIWHMFHVPIGFPYRNSYLLSFVLVILAYEVFLRRAEISRKMLIRTSLGFAVLLAAGYAFADWYYAAYPYVSAMRVKWGLLALSLALLLANALLLSKGARRGFATALLVLLMLDSGFNFYQMAATAYFGSSSQFAAYEKTLTGAAGAAARQSGTALQRVENDLTRPKNDLYGYNDSLFAPFDGLQSYTSTLNEKLRETLQKLGLYSENVRRISDIGLTAFTEYLLDVNDEIVPNPEGAVAGDADVTGGAVAGEAGVAGVGGGYAILQKNTQPTSIGYVLPDLNAVRIEPLDPYGNQNRLAQAIAKDPALELFTPCPAIQAESAEAAALAPKPFSAAPGPFSAFTTIKPPPHKTWDMTAPISGDLYVYLPRDFGWSVAVTVNGRLQNEAIPGYMAVLIRLADVRQGDDIELAFTGLSSPELPYDAFQIMNPDVLKQVIGAMSDQRADLAYNPAQNRFTGSVNARESGVLFLSIPYDIQWQVFVDGKPAPVKAVLDGTFIGVDLTSGQHSLKISYSPTIFFYGATISGAAALCLLALCLIHRKKDRLELKRAQKTLFSDII